MRGVPRFPYWILLAAAAVLLPTAAGAQSPSPAVAVDNGPMRLVSYSGRLPVGRGSCAITFAIYRDESGGAPLWQETQNVAVDSHGRYTVQLGAATSGLPSDLFTSDEPRWLEVQPQGQPEQTRVRLVSVPYAIKASEADRLAGHSADEFVTTEALRTTVQQQVQQQLSSATATPAGAGGAIAAANGTPPFQIRSNTAVPNLDAGLLGGLPSRRFIQNSLNRQAHTNFNIAGQGTLGTAGIIGSDPSVHGQVAVIRDDLDYIHSSAGQAGQQVHLRVSRAQPDPNGAKDFLIVPYTSGMAMEYAGVLEAWVDDFSVHTNQRFQGSNTPARFWVGDESDLGGLFVTARNNGGGANSFVTLAADRFTHQSHGTMQFQVRDQEDGYKWQWGAYGSDVTRAYLSNTATATNLSLMYGSVQGIFAADSSNSGTISLGSASATPVSLVAGNAGVARIFPDGNLSIGNSQDTARLSVGSGGLFSVSDAGAVAAASLSSNSISANSLNTGSLTMSGPLSATSISASGAVTSSSLNTGALTATSINSNSVTTPSLNVTTASATTVNADSSINNSLTLGNGTPIVGHLSVVAIINFSAIAANSCQTQTASVPGASDGDTVVLGIPNALGSVDGVTWFAWVSAAGTVSIRGCNATLIATGSPPPASIRLDVWKH